MEFLTSQIDLEQLHDPRPWANLPRLFAAALILAAFWLLYRLTRRPMRAALSHTGLHDKLVDLLVGSLYRYVLAAFGLVMALSQLGVNVGAAVAGLGVAGIAVGLAAQDTLSNTIAGFTIFWDKPFVVGDYITVAGQYGMVMDITLRSTRIRTPRNSYVVIPNKRIIDEVLENDTTNGELRVDVPIGIAYKEDTEAARRPCWTRCATWTRCWTIPRPRWWCEACGDSSVDLVVRVWIDEAKARQGVQFAVTGGGQARAGRGGHRDPLPHLQLFWDDVRPEVIERLRPLAGRDPAA